VFEKDNPKEIAASLKFDTMPEDADIAMQADGASF